MPLCRADGTRRASRVTSAAWMSPHLRAIIPGVGRAVRRHPPAPRRAGTSVPAAAPAKNPAKIIKNKGGHCRVRPGKLATSYLVVIHLLSAGVCVCVCCVGELSEDPTHSIDCHSRPFSLGHRLVPNGREFFVSVSIPRKLSSQPSGSET